MVTLDDDTTRLNLLNYGLLALVAEHQQLRQRWATAATDARTWPDMNLATRLFVAIQPKQGLTR